MSGIQKDDPKKKTKICSVSTCNRIATRQRLGFRKLPLRVVDCCDEHFEEGYDSRVEKMYLDTYKNLGPWGIKDVDAYFKKLTKKT